MSLISNIHRTKRHFTKRHNKIKRSKKRIHKLLKSKKRTRVSKRSKKYKKGKYTIKIYRRKYVGGFEPISIISMIIATIQTIRKLNVKNKERQQLMLNELFDNNIPNEINSKNDTKELFQFLNKPENITKYNITEEKLNKFLSNYKLTSLVKEKAKELIKPINFLFEKHEQLKLSEPTEDDYKISLSYLKKQIDELNKELNNTNQNEEQNKKNTYINELINRIRVVIKIIENSSKTPSNSLVNKEDDNGSSGPSERADIFNDYKEVTTTIKVIDYIMTDIASQKETYVDLKEHMKELGKLKDILFNIRYNLEKENPILLEQKEQKEQNGESKVEKAEAQEALVTAQEALAVAQKALKDI